MAWCSAKNTQAFKTSRKFQSIIKTHRMAAVYKSCHFSLLVTYSASRFRSLLLSSSSSSSSSSIHLFVPSFVRPFIHSFIQRESWSGAESCSLHDTQFPYLDILALIFVSQKRIWWPKVRSCSATADLSG